ncbi:DEKNAAC104463 [Brettanomyces naardenensis]|uniref:DEKNAAC104463 n=1 Tax=Brettanomyces naardenensis TaxID=13370 RepID=A0A448YRM0_BRENA|nr:DEKNAAC104463 [Brettanomyces naardenensis]
MDLRNGSKKNGRVKRRRVDIYRFDHSLFKTPIPNYRLYTDSTIELLTGSSSQNKLNWYRDYGILASAGSATGPAGNAVVQPAMWNERLVQLARKSSEDADTVTVLLCERPDTAPFQKVILNLIERRHLHFDLTKMLVHPESLKMCMEWLLGIFPDTSEISYYASKEYITDHEITRYMTRHHSGINFFRIGVPFVFSFLDSDTECLLVDKLVGRYNQIRKPAAIISKSMQGMAFKLSIRDTKLLLSSLLKEEEEYIPSNLRDKLVFDASEIRVSYHMLSKEKSLKLGAFGKSIPVEVKEFGCIPGTVYVVKVSLPTRNHVYCYGNIPLIVVAYDLSIDPRKLGSYINGITRWVRLPEASQVLRAVPQINELIRIKI